MVKKLVLENRKRRQAQARLADVQRASPHPQHDFLNTRTLDDGPAPLEVRSRGVVNPKRTVRADPLGS